MSDTSLQKPVEKTKSMPSIKAIVYTNDLVAPDAVVDLPSGLL